METQLKLHSENTSSVTLLGLPDNDRKLIESCLRGECDAQRNLYDRFCERVYRLMFRMVGSTHADDLTQQVFICIFRKLAMFHGRSLFSTWLYRVATNEALQFLRRPSHDAQMSIRCEVADTRPSATEQVEMRDVLDYALSQLDVDHRAVFLLRESEGLSYYDIAIALDIAEGTVASRLHRARRYLRAEITSQSI
ncbi:RNA polymerase sigma factor [Botrimarina mediterranea]|uniref:RNA polymerase sigma factor n=1 Tax=Botrimarina mediterranea TaxID=2528022 RepID=UPI001189D1A8|nr:ECF RNA polymerase sigma factor SigW [Planctomycetes bacterium K2D]